MSYPDQPGHRHVDTSADAAKVITNAASRLQRTTLFALQEVGSRGLTSQELADRTGIDFASIQPRTSELRRKGLIKDSGQRRHNRNGKRAIVWVAGDAT
jgi:DNA-binding IclR family transcriptional regulator